MSVNRRPLLQGAGILLVACVAGSAQSKYEELGQIGMSREHAAWPSPESVVRNLRSPDAAVRVKAVVRVGFPKKTLSESVRPTQFELRYAALGSDETQQAIVAVQVDQYGYAAVVTPKGNGWERIAQFGCWCKYDMNNFLDEFVGIVQAPEPNVERSELVIRASGGGSGLSNQDEAHFRYFTGK